MSAKRRKSRTEISGVLYCATLRTICLAVRPHKVVLIYALLRTICYAVQCVRSEGLLTLARRTYSSWNSMTSLNLLSQRFVSKPQAEWLLHGCFAFRQNFRQFLKKCNNAHFFLRWLNDRVFWGISAAREQAFMPALNYLMRTNSADFSPALSSFTPTSDVGSIKNITYLYFFTQEFGNVKNYS